MLRKGPFRHGLPGLNPVTAMPASPPSHLSPAYVEKHARARASDTDERLTLRAALRGCGLASWSAGCGILERRERRFFNSSNPVAGKNVFGKNLRVALVKQTTYSDLYSNPAAGTPRELLESSWHRTGPLGLFTSFTSRFMIVHPEPDAECAVALEKTAYAAIDPLRAADDERRRLAQQAVAVRAGDVDWSEFDVVIAIENSVPARITRRHPGVLWATLLEHHRMARFRDYLRQPPTGYDAFLNLRFGPNPQSVLRRPHVIDWPYNFNAPGGLANLYPEIERESLVMLEDHQDDVMKGAITTRGCRWTGGTITAVSLRQFVESLARSKVFCAARPSRPLGGLALIDAVAAGCVVIADRSKLWNPFLITPESDVRDASEAAKLASRLLVDDALFQKIQAEQNRRLAWFCLERPLRQLDALIQMCARKLTARAHQTVRQTTVC